MHGSRASIAALLDALVKEKPSGCAVCVPCPYLEQVSQRLRGSPIAWGAQNVSEHAQGAYTGETSAAMLAEFGCRYVIVGHSERRQLYGESDAQAAAKFAAATAAGLTPILCVGETLQERDAGKTQEVVARQLGAVDFKEGVLAYEPVWAIGTGDAASPDDAEIVASQIRAILRELDPGGADEVPIQYGGSVTDANALDFFRQPDSDGALVGGASLKADAFAAILRAGDAAVRGADA